MAQNRSQDSKKEDLSFRDFEGINTQSSRTTIKDNEFAWIENVMPIGSGNAKVVPARSAILATIGSGTCYYMQTANIANIDYFFMFSTDGSAYQVDLSSNTITTFAGLHTFSGTNTQICQWKNDRILIIDKTKGYFSWDAITLLNINSSVSSFAVTSPGTAYTAVPDVTITPVSGGSGAAATAVLGMSAAIVGLGGTGYYVNNVLTVTGGTFATAATLYVTQVNGSGAITGFSISGAGDYTTPPYGLVSVTGGNGSSAVFNPVWGIVELVLTAGGEGYIVAPTVSFSVGAASATAYLSVAPSGGTCISSFSGRVWISSGRTIVFSAPGSYTDFSVTNAAGSLIISDETLHSNINQLSVANNFLYVVGDTSINVIGDLQVSSGITVFSNTNVSSTVGSTFPNSVIPYYRSLWFSNKYGIYALYGSTTQKVSDPLDGIYQLIDFTLPICSAQFILNNVLCLAFLVYYKDPASASRKILLVYANKKWFIASQGDTISFVAGANAEGIPSAYCTDGTNLYRLFSDTTSDISSVLKTKLWDMGSPLRIKQSLKMGVEFDASVSAPFINSTIDTEIGSYPVSVKLTNYMVWTNGSGGTIPWTSSTGTLYWSYIGKSFSRFDIDAYGNYIGITVTSNTPGIIYSGLHLQYENRATWTGYPF